MSRRTRGEGDRYLLDAIRAGDAEAYRQLIDRFSGRLAACASRRLSGTGIDPEDAVQEAFMGLLQSIDRLEGVRSIEAYLFRILRNKVVDLTAKRPEAHGMHRVPLAQPEDSAGGGSRGYEPLSPAETPSSHARREEAADVRGEVLADILDELIGEHQKEKNFRDLKSLELLFYRSWKNRDIAREVGTSEPTVTRIKAAALDALARKASRHPRMDRSLELLPAEEDLSGLIRETWQRNLFSCLKRSTLGAFALEALDEEWTDYIRFHLETVGCEVCQANLDDLESEKREPVADLRERLFASSVGFVRMRQRGG